jgi:protein SCO1/2
MNSLSKSILGLLIVAALLSIMIIVAQTLNVFKPQATSEKLLDMGYFQFNRPRPIGDILLENLNGKSVTLTNRHQQWQLVNFGYMFCPDICPINLRLMSDLKKLWDSGDHQKNLAITHITFDPQRDTLERLKPYLEYYHLELAGLSGDLDNIKKLAKQLNTLFIHEKPDEYGNYFITHSDSISLINPAGEYVGLFKAPYDKDKIFAVLSLLIR